MKAQSNDKYCNSYYEKQRQTVEFDVFECPLNKTLGLVSAGEIKVSYRTTMLATGERQYQSPE